MLLTIIGVRVRRRSWLRIPFIQTTPNEMAPTVKENNASFLSNASQQYGAHVQYNYNLFNYLAS